MKKTAFIAALALAAPMALAMPPYFGGPPTPEQQTQRMAMRLGLTPEQTESVAAILAAQREKRDAFRESHRQETRDQLSSVLTAEQLAQLDAQRERREAWRAERSGDRPCRGDGPRYGGGYGGGPRW